MELAEDKFAWAKPRPDDKQFVKSHCPRAAVRRFPGNDVSWTCYLNRNPNVRESAYFWAPSPQIAWAEGRKAIEWDIAHPKSA